jgi:hypothetical protein
LRIAIEKFRIPQKYPNLYNKIVSSRKAISNCVLFRNRKTYSLCLLYPAALCVHSEET